MRIYENATATARKIRKVLKQRFPETAFIVRSAKDAVNVDWTDGPLEEDVTAAVGWMESKRSSQDPEIGYLWEGQSYCGAEYIFMHRTISDERREAIRTFMHETDPEGADSLTSKLQWTAAEKRMQQHFCTEDLVSNQAQDVYTSPGKKRLFLVEHAEQLTAEQQLKYDLLRQLLANCEKLPNGEMILLRHGAFIDAAFLSMAQLMYPDNK
ncbi:LPD29 domain-containing protein [Paenibacillus shenyangensis]|uniref:LPD29 domain-containing protein n=1 Tax=Paenibacillus sp. A9 TaxID=1284352 RepID=UPI00036A6FDE|nr:LPD29 domain-containing protein [Paenibacillus sp. A9]